MNLHGIAVPYIGAVNPNAPCTVQVSTGYTTAADGSPTPSYTTYSNISMQIQPLSTTDLRQLDGLNLTGTMRKFYLNGHAEGVNRLAVKGGDLISANHIPGFQGPTRWLVNQQLESWSGWSCVVATLQNER